MVRGEQITLHYAESHLRHNKAKHFVDDHNNRLHDPIDIEGIWRIKWWPNQQFSFFLSLSEVKASASHAHARGASREPR